MPRYRQTPSYLQRRKGSWYFRFRLPTEIQSLFQPTEIRLSLGTRQATVARARVAKALPFVHAIKRLSGYMNELSPAAVREILHELFQTLVKHLRETREPWLDETDDLLPSLIRIGPSPAEIDKWLPRDRYQRRARAARAAVRANDVTHASAWTEKLLQSRGFDYRPDSESFRTLSLELSNLDAMYWEVQQARLDGDYDREDAFIRYYQERLNGARVIEASSSTSPTLSTAWTEYREEKTSGLPKPDWSTNTAAGQQATFDEFVEIVGDQPVGAITRETMLQYKDVVSKLPKNRRKRFPNETIDELLKLDLKASDRPSSRTIKEKLISISAFFNWGRDIKDYLDRDPMRGITVRTDSRNYAPFSQKDLEALFYSKRYVEHKHLASWHFWVPLVALYSGARQSEIAQLLISDVIQEDGVWLFSISDAGEDQRVKTDSAIRKVPVSQKLLELGWIDYIDYLKEHNHKRTFPDLTKGARSWGQKISKWFNATYKKSCEVQSDPGGSRKVFHSFRHTAITKAVGAGIPISHCQQVFGHEKSILGETATYISEFPINEVVPVIDALDWDLDHSTYREAWKIYVQAWSQLITK